MVFQAEQSAASNFNLGFWNSPVGRIAAIDCRDVSDRRALPRRVVNPLASGDLDCVATHNLAGLLETPYGKIPWLIFAIGTKDDLRRPEALLTWMAFQFPPDKLAGGLAEWHERLHGQSFLPLLVSQRNWQVPLPLLRDDPFREFVAFLDEAVDSWVTGRDNSARATSYVELELRQAKRQIENQMLYCSRMRGSKQLLFDFAMEFIKRGEPSDPLFLVVEECLYHFAEARYSAFEASLENLEFHLRSWASQITSDGLNAILASEAETKADNVRRDWLFMDHCLRAHTVSHLALGLRANGDWNFRKVRRDQLMCFAGTFRYLLLQEWGGLLGEKDYPAMGYQVLEVRTIGQVPNRSQFKEVARILTLAALERQYGISCLSIIKVAKDGCHEIAFLPQDAVGNRCLFKITFQERPKNNLCLFGEIDAPRGHIRLIGPPIPPEAQANLQLLMFLVSVAYRDLLVARERLGTSVARNRASTKQPSSHSVRYLPRFKGLIDENLAEPGRFLETLRQVCPHLRIAHLRKLPEGHQASDKQRQLAEDYGWLLPDGSTFVRETEIAGGSLAEPDEVRKHFRSLSLLEILFSSQE